MAMSVYRSSFLAHLILFLTLIVIVTSRKHTLELKNDVRSYFVLTSFGFFDEGFLEIHLKKFSFSSNNKSLVFGFSLDKTYSNAISPYLENHRDDCILEDGKRDLEMMPATFFTMDLNKMELKVTCSNSMERLLIQPKNITAPKKEQREKQDNLSDGALMHRRSVLESPSESTSNEKEMKSTKPQEKVTVTETTPDIKTTKEKSSVDENIKKPAIKKIENSEVEKNVVNLKESTSEFPDTIGQACKSVEPIPITRKVENGITVFETGFTVRIRRLEEEGLYSLYFHNCPNYKRARDSPLTKINLTIDMVEMNGENYLSAGQMPLPTVHFFSSLFFFVAGLIWIYVLKQSRSEDIFKIHYLMALLVFIKSLSLLFHGINYYFIEISGIHIETWAVLYYITHLLKGALLFITIVLIGTGWALIKHIISDKEKKIFMIVLPLQVLANVAEIIIEESEEGDLAYSAWREVLILVDLLCCGAILFPVVWSIRHLQEASQTDGKAAINLRKLKLFRHFYIMIVCYIYFTRIIVYLLKITVPFKYEWLDEAFRAAATLIFFTMTGYKFRPASNNPYLQLPQEETELEMEEVLTQGGVLDGVKQVRKQVGENEVTTKQESSHEYD